MFWKLLLRVPTAYIHSRLPGPWCGPPHARAGLAATATLSPTCHGEAGPIALPGLPAVFVLGDAAVGGEGVLLLHVRDV